ncbi:hypothetical protein A0H81_00045 [Grifola frondosa]|uniref:Uncharacterized protein n=1 Tax=Grifola frondosa TaxID=5627 RepID=A0A1C7MQT6_GRIFR|nr:hypothetical protein A0H81_00045 [Grifola frondosa]
MAGRVPILPVSRCSYLVFKHAGVVGGSDASPILLPRWTWHEKQPDCRIEVQATVVHHDDNAYKLKVRTAHLKITQNRSPL